MIMITIMITGNAVIIISPKPDPNSVFTFLARNFLTPHSLKGVLFITLKSGLLIKNKICLLNKLI